MRAHRSNPTDAENALCQLLRGKKLAGYKFRRQHIIGSYIADFVCLDKMLIIEVDGIIHQLPDNKVNDLERTEWLNKEGFTLIRFTNEAAPIRLLILVLSVPHFRHANVTVPLFVFSGPKHR